SERDFERQQKQLDQRAIEMTTDLFTRKARALLAPRPVNVQWSKDVGIPMPSLNRPVPLPAILPPTEIPLGPKAPDLESLDLVMAQTTGAPINIGSHSTAEMGGRGERSGTFVDGR